jgi:hypothetical protein
MNARERVKNLLPNGTPRYVRVYDNGGTSADRYAVIFSGKYTHKTAKQHWLLGMSENPFWPQGVCLHSQYPYQCDALNGKWPPAVGKRCHLGTRISFSDLPSDCQKVTMKDYCYLWDLPALE